MAHTTQSFKSFEKAPHNKENPFTQISNKSIRSGLTGDEIGLLTILLSQGDRFVIYNSYLYKNFGYKQHSLDTRMNGLIQKGHIARQLLRNGPDGLQYYYIISEHAQPIENLQKTLNEQISKLGLLAKAKPIQKIAKASVAPPPYGDFPHTPYGDFPHIRIPTPKENLVVKETYKEKVTSANHSEYVCTFFEKLSLKAHQLKELFQFSDEILRKAIDHYESATSAYKAKAITSPFAWIRKCCREDGHWKERPEQIERKKMREKEDRVNLAGQIHNWVKLLVKADPENVLASNRIQMNDFFMEVGSSQVEYLDERFVPSIRAICNKIIPIKPEYQPLMSLLQCPPDKVRYGR